MQELQFRTDQVYHMASVMHRAARAEDNTTYGLTETVARLEYENKTLRELLSQTLMDKKIVQDVADPGQKADGHP